MKVSGTPVQGRLPPWSPARPAATDPAPGQPATREPQAGTARAAPTVSPRPATSSGVAGAARPVPAEPSQVSATRASEGVRPARALVDQVRGAIEERLGMLPAARAAAGDVDSPQEALSAVGRLFRSAAADPVLGVRASPVALQQALELGVARAAAALASDGALAAADQTLLSDLAALAARRLAAARGPAPNVPARDLGEALRVLFAELRVVLAETGLPVPADADGPVDAGRAALQLVRILAEAARLLPPADPRASRAAAEAMLDTAMRRALLQLPPDEGVLATPLQGLRVDAAELLAAAEAASARLAVPAQWTRLAIEAASALLRGQAPPFRLDLFAGRPARPAGRRRTRGGNPECVEPIETSDPEYEPPVDDEGHGRAG